MKMFRCLAFGAAALTGAAAAEAQQFPDLASDLAKQAATYREVFDRLASPDVSKAVLEGLANQDPQVFEALGDGLDVHDGLRCSWVKSAVKTWLETPIGREEKCFLRKDLTADEYILYLMIARQFHKPVLHDASLQLVVVGAEIEVPPGPFLEALREHGFVTCREFVTYDTTVLAPLTQVLNAYCYE